MKSSKHLKFLLLIVFGLCAFFANAQYYLNGQDPASTKWKQLNTENFQVIFPEGYERNANEYFSW